MDSAHTQIDSPSSNAIVLAQQMDNKQTATKSQLIPALKSRKRTGLENRWDHNTSADDDGTQYEIRKHKPHAHKFFSTQNLALGDNQDPGGNHQPDCVISINTPVNVSVGSELLQNQLRVEEHHDQVDDSAISLDDVNHHDNSSLPNGALAPALKVPQGP